MSTAVYIKSWRKEYKKISKVYCKAISNDIYMNSEGFNHLIYKRGHRRNLREIHYRLELIPFIQPTISKSKNIVEVRSQFINIKGKSKEIIFVELNYIDNRNGLIAVIIKKTGSSKHWVFQSIMRKGMHNRQKTSG